MKINLINRVSGLVITHTHCIIDVIILAVVCEANGFIYHEGDEWTPYFPQLGIVDCLICTCKVAVVIIDEAYKDSNLQYTGWYYWLQKTAMPTSERLH